MSRKKKQAVQEAIIALRKQFGLTQQQLAAEMGVAVVSVRRWETSRPPSGLSLFKLLTLARNYNLPEIAGTFEQAREKEALREIRQFTRTLIPSRAPETVLGEIRAMKGHPQIGPEYVKVLRALENTLRVLQEITLDSRAIEMLNLLSQDLRQELENEEKRTKTES